MRTLFKPMSPQNDPWECFDKQLSIGKPTLTSVEFTVTNLCNLRCEHCAVGDVLTMKESTDRIPLKRLLSRLDEIEDLETLSITGGEPMYNIKMVDEYVYPLLKYAHARGARTQINSNLTLDLARYDSILPFLDVLHISYNYLTAEDFYNIAYVHTAHPVSFTQAEKTYQEMIRNTKQLSQQGVFVSAETLLTSHTQDKIAEIHHQIKELGCARHEVHPLYPSDFARSMSCLSLSELRDTYHRLLDNRDPDLWILFGTLPFYACSAMPEDIELITRIFQTPNVTVRNDPDGHNRLNVNIFTGDVIVTDFSDVSALGNVRHESLQQCFDNWQAYPMFQRYKCFCPQSQCTGPHIIVANTYYQNEDFSLKQGVTIKR
jgi:radical SAM/CxCxxxxC motif protein YfkAB